MCNFTFIKNVFITFSFLLLSVNTISGQCLPGQMPSSTTTHVYAASVTSNTGVANGTNAIGSDDNTVATFDSSSDVLVLDMGTTINSGTSVKVNGGDGGKLDLRVRAGTTGAWTSVGTDLSLDYTFSSPINWRYIEVKRGSNFSGNVTLSSIDASVVTTTCVIDPNFTVDTDADGVPDWKDLDDDNDGILDTVECLGCSVKFANGGFEDPVIAGSTYTLLNQTAVPGWNTTATDGHIEIWKSGFMGVPAAEGNQFVELNANQVSTLYQEFCLNGAGGTVTWSLKHRGREGTDIASVNMGETVATATEQVRMSDGNSSWGSYSGTYTIAPGKTVLVIAFKSISSNGSSGASSVGNFLDDIKITINESCADTDGDGIPNSLETDSDNDGCTDANEYYNNTTADGGDGGAYGVGKPAVDLNGKVTAASYTGSYTNVTKATKVTVTTPPANQTVAICKSATFSVVANAANAISYTNGVPNYTVPPATDVSGSITYQWQENGVNLTNTGVYSGTTTANLGISNVSGLNGKIYTVIVKHPDNVCFSASPNATLTVAPLPAAPTIGTITQPTCTVSTGSVVLSGLPTGNWTITRSPGNVTTTGTGASTTITGLPASGTYTFRVTNADGCSSAASSNVVINAQPVAPVAPVATAATVITCNSFTANWNAAAGATSYGLSVSNNSNFSSHVSTNLDGRDLGNTATSYSVTGLAPGTYFYRVWSYNSCTTGVVSNVIQVTLNPAVSIAPFSPTTSSRCQGAGTVTRTTTATNATGITYSLDAGSLAGGNTIDAVTGTVTYAATWSGTTTITASAAGCNGPVTTTHVVTVNAFAGTANNTTPTTAICETATKTLTATPAGGTWSIVSGGGSITGSVYTPADVTADTAVTIRYTVASNGSCAASSSDVTFTVNAFAGTANNTTPTTAICETATKTLTATPAGGTWSIVSGGGSITGSVYTPADVTADTAVTIRYTVASNGSCAASSSDVTFTVNAFAGTANNTTPTTAICETATKTLTATPAGGTWSIVSGGGSITGSVYTPADVTADTAVTIRYTVASNGSCAASSSDVTFTVNAFAGTATNTTPTTAICETATKTLTATPAGGTWSIVSGGGSITGSVYTPADVSTNTNVTIRYTVASNGSCAASSSDVTFTVNAFAGTANNTTPTTAICETATKTLTATPAGGTWSIVSGGGSITGSVYTPADVTADTAVTIRYTVASNGSCAASSSDVTFTVNAFAGTANNTTPTTAICETATKTLTATPAGGIWSIISGGGSITGSVYTPADVTANTAVTIRYTVASNGSCAASSSDVTFTVNAFAGTANNTTPTTAICETATKTLTATPAGGTWSIVSGGGSITGSVYTPADVTADTAVTIRYTVASNGSCAASSSDVTFTVNAFAGTANNTTPTTAICETATKTLTATPAGGTWSIVSGGGSITGSVYTPADVTADTAVTIRYTVASNGSCAASSSDVTFTVNAFAGTANNTTPTTAICETATKTLTATPAGGTWSIVSGGGSITGSVYTPADVTADTAVTIRYTVASNGSCAASSSDVTFTVNAFAGTATNTTPTTAICETATKTLTATPAGGTWSIVSGGGSITGSVYTPADVTADTAVTIRYTVASNGSCAATSSDVTFTVNAFAGTANNTTPTTAICETATKTLTATPAGGTWSIVSGGGSITGSVYTPADVTADTAVTIRYTVASNGSCAASSSDVTFTVNAFAGTANNTTPTTAICETATKTLTATPAGGTWSIVSGGGSITGSVYTPADVTADTAVTIRYTVASNGSCAASSSDVTFTVNAFAGTANNTTPTTAICETATKTLTATPAGGTWSIVSGGGSITGSVYTPADVTADTAVTIRYTVASNGSCAASSSDVTFTVNAFAGTATNTTPTTAICETATKTLTATPAGGTWSIVSGGGSITGSVYTPANVTADTAVTIRYTVASNGSCAASSSDVTFTVNAFAGTANNTTPTTAICETATKTLTATPAGGTWSIVSGGGSITGSVYTPADVTADTAVTIRYTVASNGSCAASSSDVTFTVSPLPTASITGALTACLTTTLSAVTDASSATFVWYKDNTVISGQTNQTLTVTQDGDYKVKVINTLTGCEQTSAVSTVKVSDTQKPTKPVLADITGECNATVIAPTTTDNCSGTITGTTTDPLIYNTQGTHSITWSFDDGNGNIETAIQKVILKDLTQPTITCPSNVTAVADTNSCAATGVVLGTPVTSDNCSGTVTVTNDAPSSFPIGITTVTWTATDAAGNTQTCTQTVTVNDTQKPTITCPSNVTAVADTNSCAATGVVLGTPTTSDNCSGTVTVTNDAPSSFPIGTTTVTWTATDAAGNTQTCTQTVTVSDTQKPTITCPSNVTAVADTNSCAATGVVLGTPVTSDNCSGTVTVTVTNDAPSSFPIGTTTVTWTATDAAGNTQTCTQTVTVSDTQKPTITCPSNVTAVADVNSCTATGVVLGTPTTSDNCSGTVTVTNDAPSSFPIGTTTVTWTATDAAGNTQTCTQTVTVNDTQKPTITCPSNVTAVADVNSCAATGVVLGTPVTSDNCSGTVTVTNDAPSSFPIGITTVTWTATDAAGNTQTCTQTVTVNDTQKPTITCPSNVTAVADVNSCAATGVVLGTPTTSDNCSGTITVTNDAPSSFPIGITTVIWTATDAAGNTQTCTQTVTVNDTQKPTITCPSNVTAVADTNSCAATGVVLGTPVTSDNCSGTVTVTNDAPSSFPIGITTVTWTATDAAGNTQTCTQTVKVIGPIKAIEDRVTSFNGVLGGIAVPSVLDNDSLNCKNVVSNEVIITSTTTLPSNLNFDTNTGAVTVQPNTPTGTYTFDYQICEVANPIANCATATVTIIVQNPIVANVDNSYPVQTPGTTTATTIGNVTANDTLNGQPVTAANTNVTPIKTGPLSIDANGVLTLDPNTVSGTYQITYEICEEGATPANCATATATVEVKNPIVANVDNSYPVQTPGTTTATTIGNVTANDTLNGQPVTAANTNVTPIKTGPLSIDANGVLTLDPNTVSGTYQITYEICEEGATPANCATATATVEVKNPIVANVDNSYPVQTPGTTTATTIGNVTANDTLNGQPVTAANTNVTPIKTGPLSIDANGVLTLDPNTVTGTYQITYEICEEGATPANCATATATVEVKNPIVANVDNTYPVQTPGTTTATTVGNVTINDTLNGQPVTAANTNVTPIKTGPLSIGANGVLTLDPNTVSGTYQITYEICEEGATPANCATATATVEVKNPIVANVDNSYPVQTPGTTTATTIGNVTINDTLNGQPVTAANTNVTPIKTGPLSIDANGVLTLDPNTVTGTYQITYEICEEGATPANCATATATVEVKNPIVANVDNSYPVQTPGTTTATTIGNVTINDTLNGQPVTAANTNVTPIKTGPLSIDANGVLTLDPNTVTGTYQITYEICEEGATPANCASTTATVEVKKPIVANVDNSYPVQTPGTTTATTIGNVTANDTLNGQPVTAANTNVTPIKTGPLSIDANGVLTLDPNTVTGTYQITYEICEEGATPANCATATATVEVKNPIVASVDNSYPVQTPGTTTATTVGNVTANDTLNGQPVTAANTNVTPIKTGPLSIDANGVLTLDPNTVTGTYQITYEICEEGATPANCATATATVEVKNPIVANVDNSYPVQTPGTTTATTIGNVTANDTLNGQPVTAANTNVTPIKTGPLSIDANGVLTLDPNTVSGTYQITYEICEEGATPANCATATATVEVKNPIVANVDNTYPVQTPGTTTATTIGNVTANDTLNGQPVTAANTNVTPIKTGPLSIDANGVLTLDPNTATGTYQITYEICEEGATPANCATATATVEVKNSIVANVDNSYPVQTPGTATATTIGNVTINDTLNGQPVTVANTNVTPIKTGPLSIDANGVLTLDPNTVTGTYQITYEICEEGATPANCATATATVEVKNPIVANVDNTYPVQTPGTTTATTVGNVTINDTLNGQPVTAANTNVTPIKTGPLSIGANGVLTLDPNTVSGTYQITYEICEEGATPANCATATATVEVKKPIVANVDNSYPVQTPGTTTATTIGNVTINDTLNGQPVTVANTNVTPIKTGPLSIDANGVLTLDPNTVTGTYQITYEICEEGATPANCATATATVEVKNPIVANVDNSYPVQTPGTTTATTIGNVTANDTLNGQPVTAANTNVTPIKTGPLSIDANGVLTLDPNTVTGTYQITYEICEEGATPANCASATTTVEVGKAIINAVTEETLSINGSIGGTTASLITNDTLNGNPAVIKNSVGGVILKAINVPTGLTLNADGTVTVKAGTPIGRYEVEYSICEYLNPTNCSTVKSYVPVTGAVIKANNDNAGTVDSSKGQSSPTSIFQNDTLNGVLLTPSSVILTTIVPNPNLTLKSDGRIEVKSGTPSGTYELTYQICEALNPSNCSQAVAKITVINVIDPDPPVPLVKIVVTNDGIVNVDGINGSLEFINIFNNDLLKGLPINPSEVIFTDLSKSPYFEFNSDGTVNVKPNTPGGTYALNYQLCEKAHPTNCGTATLTVFVEVPAIAVIKTAVFNDENGSGFANAGETITYRFKVTNTGNVPLKGITISDPLPGVVVSGQAIDLGVNESDEYNFKAIYKITQSDINKGSVSNQASVQGRSNKGVVVDDISDDESILEDKPTVLPLAGCVIKVFNAFSPNGDDKNSRFYIQGLECYPSNTVEIYNRWGVLVFEKDNYNNEDRVFKGFSEGRTTIKQSEGLPVGTYFYILKYKDNESNSHEQSGYLYINK
ncbi:HYR domain-containing protein [Flavobacterium lipolyticum]|uniref:HYR domain-containing protein n=3 Tax=Flavobacterium TaxID=237 RepID=A0ABS8M0P0_9FLAO|nr:HYR domain-containing protein [Flavobacterium sp. F-126]MCC9018419.1 HYR domain-containing protein [Flavobacterium sp. F-126]